MLQQPALLPVPRVVLESIRRVLALLHAPIALQEITAHLLVYRLIQPVSLVVIQHQARRDVLHVHQERMALR